MHLAALQRQQQQQDAAPQQQQLSVTDELRQRKMAASHAKDSRPAKKFGGGTPFEYRNCIARFEQAVNSVGMDARMKLLEMAHWFSGNAADLVDSFSANKNAEEAYAKARSQLDTLYGSTCDSILPLVRQISMGKPIAESDLEGHVTLLTKLITAESTASEIGQLDQLDRRDNIADIAERRVRHIAKQVWQKDEDLKEEGRKFNFTDLKRLIQRQINILTTKNTLVTPYSTSDNPVKVAATGATGNDQGKGRPTNATPKNGTRGQQGGSPCGICNSPHDTVQCPDLLEMGPDERVTALKKRGWCFGCLDGRHMLRDCPQGRPTCSTCNKGHNTMLHGRSPPIFDSNASSFGPGENYDSLLETASTTGSEACISPILPTLPTLSQGQDSTTT